MISGYTLTTFIYIVIKMMTINFEGMAVEHFNGELFEYAVENSHLYPMEQVKSMVVPHHLLASDLIANMYLTASSDDVKRIVLISPDHEPISSRKVITSKKDWQFVGADQDYVEKLLALNFVYEDDEEIRLEHGINTQIPYINKFFKNAQVVPLAISKAINKVELDALLDRIGKDCMIISSVDFSHNLTLLEADACDEVTKRIMLSKDTDLLLGLSDRYFDSEAALYIVFSHSKKYGYDFEILEQSNSAYYISTHIPETTSYFLVGFN